MQLAHRLGEVAGKHVRQHAEGKIDAGVELLLLGARRAAQDEVGDQFGVTRVADAKPQAVEVVLVAELRDDVAQAVVPTMATAALELGDARGRSSSSCATRIASGLMRKKLAKAATAWPLRFM